jgi:hypothetical protein
MLDSWPEESSIEEPLCLICGGEMDREPCWHCLGEGGFHDCGEDCCPCAEPDLNEDCDECDGVGSYLVCPNATRHPPKEADPCPTTT